MKQVAIMAAICASKRNTFAFRLEKNQGKWEYTWAFPIKKESVSHEGYDKTIIRGTLNVGKSYPGCPSCGCKGFSVCHVCGKLSCWDQTSKTVCCGWCGAVGYISGEISYLEAGNDL